jgi:putative hemolysin
VYVLIHLLILLFLFVLSAFFSGTETALFSLSKIERRRLTERHPQLSKWVNYHLEHPRQTLITILIGNLFVNTLSTALVTLITIHSIGASYISFTLILYTVFLIFFAEIIPKTLAVRENERFSLLTSIPLRAIVIVLYPFRRLVRFVTDWILKFLVPEQKEHPDQISEEELKTLVKIGEEEGVLDRDERRMLQKLLELGERPVKEIMTPRISLALLDSDEPREKHVEMMQKHHFSHFPVYQNTVDNIIGLVSVQEYMLNPDATISKILTQPLFVPELKRIDDLLTEFKQKNQTFAVCVDEYGGTAGIVTLEDIFEEIFGEFYDEYAKVENAIRSLGHHEYMVEAKITLSEFNEYFSTHLESEAATTLSGFILEKLGEVPEKGKVIELPECEIRIHDVIRQRLIRNVVIKRRDD